MKIENELNIHQIEDYAILGNYDLDDVVLALDETIEALKGDTNVIESRSQIYGEPSIMVASDFNGQTLVALKDDFFKNIYATTEADCNELWKDDPILKEGMICLLKRAKDINIPVNQVWSGDIIFFESGLRKEKLFGENYYTFTSDEMKYLIAEKDPIGNKVNESKIGIAWRASYKGSTIESLNLHLDTTLSHIHYVPEIFQIDSDMINITGRSTLTKEETKQVENTLEKLSSRREFIINHETYVAMRLSKYFSNELIKFKNHILDTESEEKWKYFNARGFKSYENALFEESKVKALGGLKQKIIEEKRLELVRMINKNKDLLDAIFYVQKEIILMKDFLEEKISKMGLNKDIRGYIDQGLLPASYEETAIISHGPDVSIIVSAIPFNACNTTKDIVSSWFTNNNRLNESIVRDFNKGPSEDLNIATMIQNDIFGDDIEIKVNNSTRKEARFDVMPSKANENTSRKEIADIIYSRVSLNPKIKVLNYYLFEDRRPVLNLKIDNLIIKLEFKDRSDKVGSIDASKTKAMEELHAFYLGQLQNGTPENFTPNLTEEKGLDIKWYNSIKSSCEAIYNYLDHNKLYTFSVNNYVVNPLGTKYESIHNLVNKAFTNKNIFLSSKKDTWNPSDMYACSLDSYNDFVTKWKGLMNNNATIKSMLGINPEDEVTANNFNKLLKEFIDTKDVIGISLKKLGNSTSVTYMGYEENKVEPTYSFIFPRGFSIPNFAINPLECGLKGVYYSTCHASEEGVQHTTEWQFRISSGNSMSLEANGKNCKARLGKCDKGVLNAYLKKYGSYYPDTYTTFSRNVLGKMKERLYMMANNITRSHLKVILANGELFDYNKFISFCEQADLFINNKDEYFKIYGEELNSLDRNSCIKTLITLARCINFLNMIAVAQMNNETNNLFSKLFTEVSHDGINNAPYIKVN